MDIVSLSIMAVSSKFDPTQSCPEYLDKNFTPFEGEVRFILRNQFDEVEVKDFAKDLNDHVAAIRLGISIAQEK